MSILMRTCGVKVTIVKMRILVYWKMVGVFEGPSLRFGTKFQVDLSRPFVFKWYDKPTGGVLEGLKKNLIFTIFDHYGQGIYRGTFCQFLEKVKNGDFEGVSN